MYAYAKNSPLQGVDPTGLYSPSHQHCVALLEKIKRLEEQCNQRCIEYAEDRLSLPERIGRGEKLCQTRRGHRTEIRICETRLDYYNARYKAECSDPEPDPPPKLECDANCQKKLQIIAFMTLIGTIALKLIWLCP